MKNKKPTIPEKEKVRVNKTKECIEFCVNLIQKNHKDCNVIAIIGNDIVIIKKITVSVKSVNSRPIFQPRESVDEKTYCVLAILRVLDLGKQSRSLKQKEDASHFAEFGCPIICLTGPYQVDNCISSIC